MPRCLKLPGMERVYPKAVGTDASRGQRFVASETKEIEAGGLTLLSLLKLIPQQLPDQADHGPVVQKLVKFRRGDFGISRQLPLFSRIGFKVTFRSGRRAHCSVVMFIRWLDSRSSY